MFLAQTTDSSRCKHALDCVGWDMKRYHVKARGCLVYLCIMKLGHTYVSPEDKWGGLKLTQVTCYDQQWIPGLCTVPNSSSVAITYRTLAVCYVLQRSNLASVLFLLSDLFSLLLSPESLSLIFVQTHLILLGNTSDPCLPGHSAHLLFFSGSADVLVVVLSNLSDMRAAASVWTVSTLASIFKWVGSVLFILVSNFFQNFRCYVKDQCLLLSVIYYNN